MVTRVNFRIFANFLIMIIPIMVFFKKNFENHLKGGFIKIRKFILVIIFVIFDDLNLEIKISKFLGIEPN